MAIREPNWQHGSAVYSSRNKNNHNFWNCAEGGNRSKYNNNNKHIRPWNNQTQICIPSFERNEMNYEDEERNVPFPFATTLSFTRAFASVIIVAPGPALTFSVRF